MPDSMSLSLILSAAQGAALAEGAVMSARRTAAPLQVIGDRWLEVGRAIQILIAAPEDVALSPLRDAIAKSIGEVHIDINLIADEPAYSRKRLLVADMESTIIEQEMIDELADYVGRREEIEKITASAMRGELDFEAALRERVAMLAGLDAHVLEEVYDKRVTLMPGADTLIKTMKANGAYCALVSGGFTVFTERVARRLGFDEHQANVLELSGGKLTGRVKEPILGRAAKRAALERIARRLGLSLAQTIAVGDGANDLDMLAAAGLGVAFRAKPRVQKAASALPNGAVITYGDLTALLYLQGYSASEFHS